MVTLEATTTIQRRSAAFALAMALLLTLAGCGSPSASHQPGEWRQWRGPAGLGISPETDLPVKWGEGSSNIRWKVPIPGAGNSSPIVGQGRVFLTTAEKLQGSSGGKKGRVGPIRRSLVALDIETGATLWTTKVSEARRGKRHWINTYAAPTPATDGEMVYVTFGQQLAAVDYSGEILWNVEIDSRYVEDSHYGASASPVVIDGLVVVAQDREESLEEQVGWLAAFDAETGREVWRQEWSHTCCSYVTPLIIDGAEGREVVHVSSGEVVGYDLTTGREVWRSENSTTQPVPSPVYADGLLVTPGGIHTKVLTVHRLDGQEGVQRGEIVWGSPKSVPEIASPVIVGDRLYTLTESGVVSALSAADGELLWRHRLPPGPYRASLVAGDGKIYATSQTGLTSVFASDADGFELLGSNQLAGGNTASAAIADGCLLLRSKKDLYCVEQRTDEVVARTAG